jgi:hypothetical protein
MYNIKEKTVNNNNNKIKYLTLITFNKKEKNKIIYLIIRQIKLIICQIKIINNNYLIKINNSKKILVKIFNFNKIFY